jgi:hypothetical protein
MEQTMLMLIQKTKKLEQEVQHLQERETERQRIQELESIVTTLLQRLNMVEQNETISETEQVKHKEEMEQNQWK